MDPISPVLPASPILSEESPDDASTWPTTPSSSPLFASTPKLDNLIAPCSLSTPKTSITNGCVIGAGYVGKSITLSI